MSFLPPFHLSFVCCVSAYSYMFYGASAFDQSLCWDVPPTCDTSNMFDQSPGSLAPFPDCLAANEVPSGEPTGHSSGEPTGEPTASLSVESTTAPSSEPTGTPAGQPSSVPTVTVTSASGFQPADRTALKTAVEAWCTDESAATTTYGDINTWDVRTRICTHSLCCLPHPCP